ncbi:MAG TPA: hypothetical protein VEX63_13650 [Flavisolibacter sp.]|jgi:hypothetical protein|nr:hypothetical protein [Flavisolibacter sp.]HZI02189.1 hypothetical protein [Flavisolibacter sp.]
MQKTCFFLFAAFSSVMALAQEGGADINVDINKGGGSSWYTSPMVWVIGAALFILLLVALSRGGGGSRSSRTVERTTTDTGGRVTETRVERDTDPDIV